MRYVDFTKSEDAKRQTALFFFGEENFFREQAIQLLKSTNLTMDGIDFDVFDAKTVPIESVAAVLQTPPFLNRRRVVVLKEFYPGVKEYTKSPIALFAKTEQNFSVLAVVNEKPCEAIANDSYFLPVDCGREGDSYLAFYARETLGKRNVEISSIAAAALAESCAGSMTRLSVEIDKLTAFAQGVGKVEKEDVFSLVHREVETQVFDLTDALALKNTAKTLYILDALIKNNEKPQMIFVAVYNAFRRMLHVSLSEKSDKELAQDLGVKSEYAIRKSRQAARAFSKRNLKKICDKFCESDAKMKSGGLVADGVLYDCIYYVLSL